MILVGIGCSFTVGEGVETKDNWLSLLGQSVGCEVLNLAHSGNSNHGIAQQFAHFVCYERHMYEKIAVVISWTEVDRMSWWDEDSYHWVHSTLIDSNDSNIYTQSYKEWIMHGQGGEASGNQALTDSAKLFVYSVCKAQNIPLIYFNALGKHHTYHEYENYYLPDTNTLDYLKNDQLIPNDGHPNELGHTDIASRLYNFINECKIL